MSYKNALRAVAMIRLPGPENAVAADPGLANDCRLARFVKRKPA